MKKNIVLTIIFIGLVFIFNLNAYYLVDDFEDGDEFNNYKGVWYTISDDDETDKSSWVDYNGDGIHTGTLIIPGTEDSMLPVFGGANQSVYALKAYIDTTVSEYKTGDDQTPYAGIGASFGEDEQKNDKIADLSDYYAVGFQVKSDAITKFKFSFEEVKDSIYKEVYSKEITIKTNEWNTILVPFSKMSLLEVYKNNVYYAGYPDDVKDYDSLTNVTGHKVFNTDAVISLGFNFIGTSIKGNFYVDNLYFLTKAEYEKNSLPIDSDNNGINDGVDTVRLQNVDYSVSGNEIKLNLSFNRTDIIGDVKLIIANMNFGILKTETKKVSESSSSVTLITIQKSDASGKILSPGLYILKVEFSDNFGNKSYKTVALVLE